MTQSHKIQATDTKHMAPNATKIPMIPPEEDSELESSYNLNFVLFLIKVDKKFISVSINEHKPKVLLFRNSESSNLQ